MGSCKANSRHLFLYFQFEVFPLTTSTTSTTSSGTNMKGQEQAMAPHSSTLAWKIHGRRSLVGCSPWGHEESNTTERLHFHFPLSTFTFTFHFMHWRRKWQPTPVFLPGESQGLGSLEGCCLWGHTESDTTGVTQQQQQPRLRRKHST